MHQAVAAQQSGPLALRNSRPGNVPIPAMGGVGIRQTEPFMKPILLAAAVIALAGGWAYYTFSTSKTPDGQPPLTVLDNAGAVKKAFNDSTTQYRMLTLLSPS